ncbi:MAG: hypothetical protein CMO01_13000 [Thalassobius sp.]|nr:hypothetical protein [Thalassovita sp.]|tara:strand:- start:176 stop:463 length:288 start_codon:yes stop_codon:yes gene_type:complete
MIFLIDKVDSEYQVIVYEDIDQLIYSVEWLDIFAGKTLIIDENGVEYKWDSTKKDEIDTVYGYTIISTSRVSDLVTECLKRVNADKDICEFNFVL